MRDKVVRLVAGRPQTIVAAAQQRARGSITYGDRIEPQRREVQEDRRLAAVFKPRTNSDLRLLREAFRYCVTGTSVPDPH